MTTQAIKHWLGRLFAWWPWRKHPETGYAQTASNSNKGPSQEPVWRATVTGTSPQPGISSVAVEHGNDEGMQEANRPFLEKPQEMIKEGRQSGAGENINTTYTTPQATSQGTGNSPRDAGAPSPTVEQRLAFIRYLAQRGLINEGFTEGQIPDQYKKKR